MRRLQLDIGTIVFEAGGSGEPLEPLAPVVRRALELLAVRLARTPGARFGAGLAPVIEHLRLGDLPLDELLGPHGAERLADALYDRLLEACI